MAKRQRNYAEEYRRRKQRAQAAGFSGYGQQRRLRKEIKTSQRAREMVGRTGSDPNQVPDDIAKAYYDAFLNPATRDDRSETGAKAYWFVEVLGVLTYREWYERYVVGRIGRAA